MTCRWTRTRSLCFIIVLTLAALIIAGCGGLAPDILPHETLSPYDPNKAYLVVGQRLGQGNLTRTALALYLDKEFIRAKGIAIPDTAKPNLFIGFGVTQFNLTGPNRHAYRVWELDPEAFAKGGRALLFVNMLAAGKTTFADRYPFGIEPCLGCGFMAPVDMRTAQGDLGDKFTGCAFIIGKPGVYYLGEVTVSGRLDRKKAGPFMDMAIEVAAAPDRARAYAASKGLPIDKFYDAAKAWQTRPLSTLGYYMAAKPNVEYFRPE